jgi:hypothetical protein
MITNGNYEDVSSESREERQNRRSRYHRFKFYLSASFSALWLLSYIFIERSREDLLGALIFAAFAAFSFSRSKKLEASEPNLPSQ